ncbi:MAG: substrate-binding domain-containing protein [Ktedonobacteraceae bacterium]|nr:substrate-binding domain-containing protein [Ktedonobacteraceae bacterium]
MSKRWRMPLILAALMAISIFISACGGDTTTGANPTSTAPASTDGVTCAQGTLRTNGSTALAPLVQDAAKAYQAKCSGSSITTQLTGSSAGLTAVSGGNADVGNSDVFADATKYPGLTDHQVAVVVFSVVINSKVTGVTNLTSAQLLNIFTNKVSNWKDVGGPDMPIVHVARPAGSGTRLTFEKFVLNGTTESGEKLTKNTTGEVAQTIKSTDGSISYVATSAVTKQGLTAIKIDGVADTDDNVKSNSYKFWNIEHMYTKGEASGLAKAFIDYVKGPATADLRKKDGFLDFSVMSQSAIDAKQPK